MASSYQFDLRFKSNIENYTAIEIPNGDTAIEFEVTIYDKHQPYDLSSTSDIDCAFVFDDGGMAHLEPDVVITDAANGIVTIPLTSTVTMRIAEVMGRLRLYDALGRRDTTQQFIFHIRETNVDDFITTQANHIHGNLATLNAITSADIQKLQDLDGHEHNNLTLLETITQAMVDNWNSSLSGTHNHVNKIQLDLITSAHLTKLNTYDWHTHANKLVLDQLTQQHIDDFANAHTHANKVAIDRLSTANVDNIQSYDWHTHTNKTVLANLTQDVIDDTHEHLNKVELDTIEQDDIDAWDTIKQSTYFIEKSALVAADEDNPTLLEVSTFIGSAGLSGRLVRYNGTDIDDGTSTYVYDVDIDGNVTEIESSTASGSHSHAYYDAIEEFSENQWRVMRYNIPKVKTASNGFTVVIGSYNYIYMNASGGTKSIYMPYPTLDGLRVVIDSRGGATYARNNLYYASSQRLGDGDCLEFISSGGKWYHTVII